MEKTMYENLSDSMKRKKGTLTLDFSSGSKKARGAVVQQDLREGLLSSPDVGLLKLATPELERFIIHQTQSGALVTTPTQILFPKSVTEEQEAYARGFVDALVELHMKQSPLTGMPPGGIVCVDPQGGSSFVTLTSVPHNMQASVDALNAMKRTPILSSPVFPQPATLNLSAALRLLPAVPSFTLPSPLQPNLPPPIPAGISIPVPTQFTVNQGSIGLSERPGSDGAKPTTVSSPTTSNRAAIGSGATSSLSSTPPLSPIDMSNQELIKLERKREKNRNAAQKCRSKKLERISRLEERVAELKAQNAVLATTAGTQREHVTILRQQIVDHVNGGCQIMLVRDVATTS